ncbi:MAG: DUF6328 family protein [Actinomycetota bacterium]
MNDRESRERSDESHKQRIDRELIEPLQELRVAIPGVQVLFAFLLTIPFSQGFSRLTDTERGFYGLCLVLAALATALLIAPTSSHRLNFRGGNKEWLLFHSNRLAIAGLALLALAICVSLFVALAVVFDTNWGVGIAGLTALWFAWFWYARPLMRRR